MELAHCIIYAIYVRMIFIIKLSYAIDILLKISFPDPTLGLFLDYSYLWSILRLSVLIKLFLQKILHLKT